MIIVTHDIDDARGLADRVGAGVGRHQPDRNGGGRLTDRDLFIAMMIGANVIPARRRPGDVD